MTSNIVPARITFMVILTLYIPLIIATMGSALNVNFTLSAILFLILSIDINKKEDLKYVKYFMGYGLFAAYLIYSGYSSLINKDQHSLLMISPYSFIYIPAIFYYLIKDKASNKIVLKENKTENKLIIFIVIIHLALFSSFIYFDEEPKERVSECHDCDSGWGQRN